MHAGHAKGGSRSGQPGRGTMTSPDDRSWVDEDAGPLVRPYAMTGGRTQPINRALDLIALVVAVPPAEPVSGLTAEHERVIELCRQPISVAEVAGNLNVPLMVATVLLGDLMAKGVVLARPPIPTVRTPDRNLLQAVLDGIRKL